MTTAQPAASPFAAIDGIVNDEIAQGHVRGAVVLIGHDGRVIYRRAFGLAEVKPDRRPMSDGAIFDLASLTKVVVTSTAVMQLAQQGRLELDAPVARYWPGFARHGKGKITVRQLLTHTSGLRPDFVSLNGIHSEADAAMAIEAEKPRPLPTAGFLYSDLNFIALGILVEKISGERLDRYAQRHIFAPLGMTTAGYLPTPSPLIVPTDLQNGVWHDGLVQDPTAYAMGGIAGHAGVFASADDLAKLAQAMLDGGDGVLTPRTVAEMIDPDAQKRGLGWDLGSDYATPFAAFGPRAFGHTGYTGTSIWIDPTTDTYLIILTSRLQPDDQGNVMPLRTRLADQVAALFRPKVLAGIDVLEDEHFAPLKGLRVGILTNRAGRDFAGHRSIDVLADAPGVQLRAIFTPEHGLDADGEGRIASGRDAATGLPVISLYGATLHPTPAMLAGLDAVVIDLQDAGARFYTYPATVAYLMKAAAAQGIKVFVLDRPDPVTGNRVEGPMLDANLTSFTGYDPLPLQPGMTLGELAQFFNARNHLGADLTVIPMQGYRRSMWYSDTGLEWIPPSPNLRTPDEAILYPAIGMLEGANLSVGRGTATPFEWLGAPWIDGNALAAVLNARHIAGVSFSPVDFTPGADIYAGQLCHGVRFSITDRNALDDGLLGLEIAAALHRLYPRQFALFRIKGSVGSAAVMEGLRQGDDPHDLSAIWQMSLREFDQLRQNFLIYQ